MSVERSPEQKPRLTVLGVIALFLTATGVIALQIALPWGSWWINRNREFDIPDVGLDEVAEEDFFVWQRRLLKYAEDQDGAVIDGSSFWQRRFRFEEFFLPTTVRHVPDRPNLDAVSSTVNRDEIVILLMTLDQETMSADPWTDPSELLRINLRSGQTTRSPVSPGIRSVLSDGQELWLLPSEFHPETFYAACPPFLWQGKPTVIVGDATSRTGDWPRLAVFDGADWHVSEDYVLLPPHSYPYKLSLAASTAFPHFGLVITKDSDDIWYGRQLELGTRQDAEQFYDQKKRIEKLTDEELQGIGWRRVKCSSFTDGLGSFYHTMSYWCDGDAFEVLRHWEIENRLIFQWFRFAVNESVQIKTLSSPSPSWPVFIFEEEGRVLSDTFVRLVQSADGRIYIVAYNLSDGRSCVFRWDRGKLFPITRHASPLIGIVCLDGSLLFVMTFAIPMLMLGWLAGRWQRRAGPQLYSAGLKTVPLATTTRRGLARTIDLILVISPILFSVIFHPDVIGWWRQVSFEASTLISAFEVLIVLPDSWHWLQKIGLKSQELVEHMIAAPRLWWLFSLGLALLILQILWQARTGQTLGKWLLGLRVLRTTLKPCGLARSLLREIWLMADSLCMLSWVPGVVAILLTERSQRIGDKMADTIVVRDAFGPVDGL